jgi:hypothetical protein
MISMDLSSQRIVSGICGAGIVVLCESEYSCLRLFRRRTTLFFFIAELTIWSSALETALVSSMYFLHNLRVLPMLVIILIVKATQYISYPIMILLRLRFVREFPVIIMCIPVVLTVIMIVLRSFWVRWILTGESEYFNQYFIVRPIATLLFTAENLIINIFFIMIAIKYFQNVVHIKFAVIVNIAVTILDGVVLLIEFLPINAWISFCTLAIVAQIKVRLEIVILSYIVQSVRERRTSDEDQSVTEGNKFCHAFDFFLSRSRTAGLT